MLRKCTLFYVCCTGLVCKDVNIFWLVSVAQLHSGTPPPCPGSSQFIRLAGPRKTLQTKYGLIGYGVDCNGTMPAQRKPGWLQTHSMLWYDRVWSDAGRDGRPVLSEPEEKPVTCCRHAAWYAVRGWKPAAAELCIVSRGGFLAWFYRFMIIPYGM